MTSLDELRRQLDYTDGHLKPLDPEAVVRAARAARHRQRSVLTGGAVLAVAVTAVAALVSATSSPLSLLDMAPPADPAPVIDPEMQPSSGFLTLEQAGRAGLDGRAACTERDPLWESGIEATAPPELVGGYLTDSAGLGFWLEEFNNMGGLTAGSSQQIHAICWYAGAFTTSSPGESDGQLEAAYLRVDFPLGADQHVGSTQVGRFPIAIIAPPLPDRTLLPPELRGTGTYVAPQPAGVQLLDGDTPPTPHPQPTPADDAFFGDCVPYSCPDATEVPVRVDARVDGESVASTDVVEVRSGDMVGAVITVTAPQQASLTALRVGVSGEGSRLDQVLVEEAAQGPGARDYRLSWQVDGPAGQRHQVRLEYTASSPLHGDQVLTHSRTVVMFSIS